MASAYSRYKRKVIKQKLKEQFSDKVINEMRDSFLNPTEEQLEELSKKISEFVKEGQEKDKEEE